MTRLQRKHRNITAAMKKEERIKRLRVAVVKFESGTEIDKEHKKLPKDAPKGVEDHKKLLL